MIIKSIIITIFNQSREIHYPKVGELLSIESRKMMLSNGTYSELISASTISSRFNLDLIDALAHFLVLIPKLSASLTVDTIYDLDALEAKEIVKVYRSQFITLIK